MDMAGCPGESKFVIDRAVLGGYGFEPTQKPAAVVQRCSSEPLMQLESTLTDQATEAMPADAFSFSMIARGAVRA